MQTAFVLTGGGSLGANGHSDQLSEMAAAPVRERVAVIVPGGDDAIIAAKSSTATIPIIFASGEEQVYGTRTIG